MNQPTTEQIRAWAEGISRSDREAFDRLFRALYYPLKYFAFRYTQSMADSRDVVQEVFIDLWQNRDSIDAEQSLKSYIFRMIRNKAINHVRDYTGRKVRLDDLPVSYVMNDTGDDQTDQAEADELGDKFAEWIREMPDRRREVFELSRFEGLKHDEIAGVMDLSIKTVNNHMVLALRHLRECYNDYIKQKKNSYRP